MMILPTVALYLFSRFAGFPQQGQVVLTHSSIAASGDSPVPVGSYDSTSGNNNGTDLQEPELHPQSGQCTIGIGSPQYLCLENTQSRNL